MLAATVETEPGEEKLLSLTLESQRLWPEFTRELEAAAGMKIGYRDEGTWSSRSTATILETLRHSYEFPRKASGSSSTGCRPSRHDARTYIQSPGSRGRCSAATTTRSTIAASPSPCGRTPAASGVEIHEHCPVRELITSPAGRAAGIVTERGEERADIVVLAAGAWSRQIGGIPGRADAPGAPDQGPDDGLQMDPSAPLISHVAVRAPHSYMVPRNDGRLIVGGTVEERGFDTRLTAGGLLRSSTRVARGAGDRGIADGAGDRAFQPRPARPPAAVDLSAGERHPDLCRRRQLHGRVRRRASHSHAVRRFPAAGRQHAFLAAEDREFYSHNGVNPLSILRAALANIVRYGHGQRPLGASTITQQLVRHFLLTNEVSISRKIKEALLAYRIENQLSKNRILEIYLNEIYLGSGAYGVAAAAETYFGKNLDQLTAADAAFLAALPKAPNNYNPQRHAQAARARRDWVLDGMAEQGWITRADADAAKAQPLDARPRPDAPTDLADTGYSARGGYAARADRPVRRKGGL